MGGTSFQQHLLSNSPAAVRVNLRETQDGRAGFRASASSRGDAVAGFRSFGREENKGRASETSVVDALGTAVLVEERVRASTMTHRFQAEDGDG